MAGMSKTQIEAKLQPLTHKMLNGGLSKEERREYESLYCRTMLNSCLVYGELYNWEKKYRPEYEAKLGGDTVDDIFREQKELFSRAIVQENAFTDSEGVSYNRVIWPDDPEWQEMRGEER